MTASALALAVEKKFDPKDDIRLVFNPPTANLAPGEMVHVYRVGHANPDPAAHLASMKTADALSTRWKTATSKWKRRGWRRASRRSESSGSRRGVSGLQGRVGLE